MKYDPNKYRHAWIEGDDLEEIVIYNDQQEHRFYIEFRDFVIGLGYEITPGLDNEMMIQGRPATEFRPTRQEIFAAANAGKFGEPDTVQNNWIRDRLDNLFNNTINPNK